MDAQPVSALPFSIRFSANGIQFDSRSRVWDMYGKFKFITYRAPNMPFRASVPCNAWTTVEEIRIFIFPPQYNKTNKLSPYKLLHLCHSETQIHQYVGSKS